MYVKTYILSSSRAAKAITCCDYGSAERCGGIRDTPRCEVVSPLPPDPPVTLWKFTDPTPIMIISVKYSTPRLPELPPVPPLLLTKLIALAGFVELRVHVLSISSLTPWFLPPDPAPPVPPRITVTGALPPLPAIRVAVLK